MNRYTMNNDGSIPTEILEVPPQPEFWSLALDKDLKWAEAWFYFILFIKKIFFY